MKKIKIIKWLKNIEDGFKKASCMRTKLEIQALENDIENYYNLKKAFMPEKNPDKEGDIERIDLLIQEKQRRINELEEYLKELGCEKYNKKKKNYES